MIRSAILGRYSKSLAEVAMEEGVEEAVTEDLKTYGEIFKAVPELLEVFHSPAVPRDAKRELLSELVSKYPVTRTTGNFLRILLDHNRIRYFEQILELYLSFLNERRGIVSAKVRTAYALSRRELESLGESLAKVTGKSVRVEVVVDTSLLGGVVVQIGSKIFDGSIRTQLTEMKRCLAAV